MSVVIVYDLVTYAVIDTSLQIMIPTDTLVLFITASTALCLAPGPDNIFVVTQSALHGRRAGLHVTLGLCTGLILHTTAVALGIASIFATSEIAFTVLKYVGAAYLIFLAWQAFKAKTLQTTSPDLGETKFLRLYGRGIFMNITNPKVAIFFLAFLPQFVAIGEANVANQLFLLGGIFMLITLITFGALAWSTGLIGEKLAKSASSQNILNKIAGTIFVALALRLVFTTR